MSRTGKWAVALLLVVGAAALTYWATHRPDTSPYVVDETTAPPQWTLVTSDGTDPWVVGVKPPDTLTRSLLDEMSKRAGTQLVAPAHTAIPLVLRAEFDEALQGAFGVDSIQRLAHDVNIEAANAFTPVCLARRTVEGTSGAADLYFVPFTSAAFNQLRGSLIPDHPEQSGVGIYDPALLTPVLIVGATEGVEDDWWPVRIDPGRDCFAEIEASGPIGPTGSVPSR